ncbi:hypothetical protein QIS74_02499 [Colletotrichum tabaci]|uniref:Uncharacterized protein n=1 Tax=Colletotrichum tabaci TaxID=1209068 RepID=A0AAV9TC45_9PEZI
MAMASCRHSAGGEAPAGMRGDPTRRPLVDADATRPKCLSGGRRRNVIREPCGIEGSGGVADVEDGPVLLPSGYMTSSTISLGEGATIGDMYGEPRAMRASAVPLAVMTVLRQSLDGVQADLLAKASRTSL